MPDHEPQASAPGDGTSGELAPVFANDQELLRAFLAAGGTTADLLKWRPDALDVGRDGAVDVPEPPTEFRLPEPEAAAPVGTSGEMVPVLPHADGRLAVLTPHELAVRTVGAVDVPKSSTAIRRLTDREQYADLSAAEFRGAVMDNFASDLWQYGLRVINSWLRDGSIPRRAQRHGVKIRPSWVELEMWERSAAAREELAVTTVREAAVWFTKTALPNGMWDPGKGASLRTYFIGACLIQFRTTYRSWSGERRQRVLEYSDGLAVHADRPAPGTDPALVMEQRETIAAILAKATPEARAICALIYATDATYTSIGEKLGMSARAVEGQMHRLRRQAKALRRPAGTGVR